MPHPAKKSPWFREIKTSLALRAAFLASVSVATILPAAPPLRAADKWRMQYFYDKEGSSLAFTDIACPSARRCVASGVLDEGKRDKGVLAITSDSGATWQLEDVRDHPISLFFLNENKGWMVTDRGIYETSEAGRNWKKIKDHKGLERVHFVNENHGWAVGAPKLVLETTDGGRKWAAVADAEKAPTAPENTIFDGIAFLNSEVGAIIGSWALPHSNSELPDWMSPDRARYRRESPSVTIILQTTDAGRHWSVLSRTMQGVLTRFSYGPHNSALALFEYPSASEIATELFTMDLVTSKNASVYREAGRAVRDFTTLPGGDVILAAVQRQGKANALPIPGKLKMMSSSSLKTWIDMDVDYRAVATRTRLAAADAHNVWVATDTGMILKWTSGGKLP